MKDLNGTIATAIDGKKFGDDNEPEIKTLKDKAEAAKTTAATAKQKVVDDRTKETATEAAYDKALADAGQAEQALSDAEANAAAVSAGPNSPEARTVQAKRDALTTANQRRSTAEADYNAAYTQRTNDEASALQSQNDADKAAKDYADAKAAGAKAASQAKADCTKMIRSSVSKYIDQRLTSVGGYANALDVISASIAPPPKTPSIGPEIPE